MRLCPDHYLQIRDLKIYNSKVENSFKIAALGDFHISRLVDGKKLDPIKFQLEKEKADYHALLGDLIDSPKELENEAKRKELISLVEASACLAPTMVILGSHDFIIEEKDSKYTSYDTDFWNEVASIDNVHLLNADIYKDERVLFMGYRQTYLYYHDSKDKHHEKFGGIL